VSRLPQSFFARPGIDVAPELLNKVLVAPGVRGRIVEVEAYMGADDPGSHAHRGPTPRTDVMFGQAGHLYVYFTYGMHWCVNVVCGEVGVASAVLLRAVTPLDGLDVMRVRRPKARRNVDLCNGPAKLASAFGFDGGYDGLDLQHNGVGVQIIDDGTPPPTRPANTVRVGLTHGAEIPWRWTVPGVADVSRPRP
jgi:DNA-3-methyladenine glycosylase